MSGHNPLDQFKIKTIYPLESFGIDISFTNSSMFMIVAVTFISLYFMISLSEAKIIPTKIQLTGELVYGMIIDLLEKNAGAEAKKYTPLIFTIFLFLLTCNLLGMLPYGFTVTSHLVVTLAIAMVVFMFVTILGFYKHGLRFFSLFLPSGTPWWLAPLMVVIELFAYLARPISLSLRLAANMMAGHLLLKIIAGFVVSSVIYLKIIPIPFIVVLIGFEIFVAILQAYIFSILSCVYLNDALNLH